MMRRKHETDALYSMR